MKKLVYCISFLFLFFSCGNNDEVQFNESEEIDLEQLKFLGENLTLALQTENEAMFLRYFSIDLFKEYCKKDMYVYDDVYQNNTFSYAVSTQFSNLLFSYEPIRKFQLERVFEEDGQGVVVISCCTGSSFYFFEFPVRKFKNHLKAYDIFYAFSGIYMSDEMFMHFQNDWKKGSSYYRDFSPIVDAYLGNDYETVIDEFESFPNKYQVDIFKKMYNYARLKNNYSEDISILDEFSFWKTCMLIEHYRDTELQSFKTELANLKERYGRSAYSRNLDIELEYTMKNYALAQKMIDEELLRDNDVAMTHFIQLYIYADQNKPKEAVKFLSILTDKFLEDKSELADMIKVTYPDMATSKEFLDWYRNYSY